MEKSYEERQAECGLKVGDWVRVVRDIKDGEDGWTWGNPLNPTNWVGRTGLIIKIVKDCISVFSEDFKDTFIFPYFILEKINNKDNSVEKSYKERQAECGLKIGDKVRILRKAESWEDGWENTWDREMDDFIGLIGKVEDVDGDAGVYVKNEFDDWFYFPYFVLEKVNEETKQEQKETPKEGFFKLTFHFTNGEVLSFVKKRGTKRGSWSYYYGDNGSHYSINFDTVTYVVEEKI